MDVAFLKSNDYGIWNDFVEQSPQGYYYDKTWYLDSYGASYKLLVVYENNMIIGGIALVKNEIGFYTNPLLSKYLGVLFCPFKGNKYKVETKKRNIIRKLIPFLNKYKTFNYCFAPSFDTYMPFYWNNYLCTIHYSYQINLEDNSDDKIYNNLYAKLKTEIKSAVKNNFTISNSIDFELFYKVLNDTFKNQGGKAPWKYSQLFRHYSKLKERNAIELNGIFNNDNKLMAVNGLVYDNKCCSYVFNGVNYDLIQKGANELLLYKSIVNKIGISKIFNIEGSMIHPIEAFYRKFNGKRVPYLRIYKDNFINYLYSKLRIKYRKIRYNK